MTAPLTPLAGCYKLKKNLEEVDGSAQVTVFWSDTSQNKAHEDSPKRMEVASSDSLLDEVPPPSRLISV